MCVKDYDVIDAEEYWNNQEEYGKSFKCLIHLDYGFVEIMKK